MTSGTYSTTLEAADQRFEPVAFKDFAWTATNAKEVERILGRYPPGRQHSAIIPLLHLAQYQIGAATGHAWLPVSVIEFVAKAIEMPYMRVHSSVSWSW